MCERLDPGENSSKITADEKTDGHFEELQRLGVDLHAARNAITGGGYPVYFGPKREAARIAAYDGELSRVLQEPLITAPLPPPNFAGGEHDVWVLGDPASRVFKQTHPGEFGMMLDEKVLFNARTFRNHRQLALRRALPSEYLLRWQILQQVFELPTLYHGRVATASGEACMAVTQPYVPQDENDPPTTEDVITFMETHGFVKVPAEHIVEPLVKEVTWYRQKDGILITDAFPRNFRKHETEHALVPIDLVVGLVLPGASELLPEPETLWPEREP